MDSVLKKGDPLAKLSSLRTAGNKVSATFTAKVPVVKGQLHYTTDTGPWQQPWRSTDGKSSITR